MIHKLLDINVTGTKGDSKEVAAEMHVSKKEIKNIYKVPISNQA